jgi:hypothetical protein
MWQPKWLLPHWYNWLRERHGKIMPFLLKEARSMRGYEWERQVSIQEGLEEWVAEVRCKYKL